MTPAPKKRRKRSVPSKRGTTQIQLTVYFYPDEHAILKQSADQLGISVSAFVAQSAIERAARK